MQDTFTLSDDKLIDLLGGTKAVSIMAKVSQAAVTQWRYSGIPEGKRLRLAATIEEKSKGLISRKLLFPNDWKKVWPELN